jgi:hypothetical protein
MSLSSSRTRDTGVERTAAHHRFVPTRPVHATGRRSNSEPQQPPPPPPLSPPHMPLGSAQSSGLQAPLAQRTTLRFSVHSAGDGSRYQRSERGFLAFAEAWLHGLARDADTSGGGVPTFLLSPGGVASARSEGSFVLGDGGTAIRAPASVEVTVARPVSRVVIPWSGGVRLAPRAEVFGVRLAPFPVVRGLGIAAIGAPASAVVLGDGSMRRAVVALAVHRSPSRSRQTAPNLETERGAAADRHQQHPRKKRKSAIWSSFMGDSGGRALSSSCCAFGESIH